MLHLGKICHVGTEGGVETSPLHEGAVGLGKIRSHPNTKAYRSLLPARRLPGIPLELGGSTQGMEQPKLYCLPRAISTTISKVTRQVDSWGKFLVILILRPIGLHDPPERLLNFPQSLVGPRKVWNNQTVLSARVISTTIRKVSRQIDVEASAKTFPLSQQTKNSTK